MTLLLKFVEIIRKHVLIFCKYDEEALGTIEMTKIYVTIDFSDRFLQPSLTDLQNHQNETAAVNQQDLYSKGFKLFPKQHDL